MARPSYTEKKNICGYLPKFLSVSEMKTSDDSGNK